MELWASLHPLGWAGVSYVLYGLYGALASWRQRGGGLRNIYAGALRQFDDIYIHIVYDSAWFGPETDAGDRRV